jgi:head-tail adaptor
VTAGELRERVAFDRRALVSDGYGNEEGDWEEQFVEPARIRPLRGGEQVMASRLQGVQPVIIKVRVSSKTRQIETDWRARDVRTNVIYALHTTANTDEKKKYFEILATAGEVP